MLMAKRWSHHPGKRHRTNQSNSGRTDTARGQRDYRNDSPHAGVARSGSIDTNAVVDQMVRRASSTGFESWWRRAESVGSAPTPSNSEVPTR
ncbi:hypothetical protein MTIM_53400 [Mycobacterium timonense]|uniref:Uncharacterized protein n=1 Tax=Mycobacterium timonense TaxID=701043 RepID=A0A7I9ZEN6_9MYCO|nr:hypothetical protein MTIM_53400 [Mycobacterium timonense]